MLEDYGWNLAWGDEFDSAELDENVWTTVNASVADGTLIITAAEGVTSSLKAVEGISAGCIEASIQLPEGSDLLSVFGLLPMADMYEGDNALTAMKADSDGIIVGAHYELGLINGVNFNSDSVAGAKAEFHSYAIEWSEEQICWYFDGAHIHTVNPLNTWASTLNGEEVVIDNAGPFNQEMQIVLELATDSVEPVAKMLVDYVKVWTCDPLIETSVENCASYVNKTISKAASDRIESVGPVITEIFNDGYFDKGEVKISDLEPLIWHYTDEMVELSIGNYNSPAIELLTLDNEHNLVIDVSHPEGDANINFAAPGVELIGKDAVLSFDMYIDSANTTSETFDIKMETGWPYLGQVNWNTAELELDTWVTYSIPVSDFVANPFVGPDWIQWVVDGAVEGDLFLLDPSEIGNILIMP